MKTADKILFLLLPLYMGCGMGIQSEEIDGVTTKSDTIAAKNTIELKNPTGYKTNEYTKNEIKSLDKNKADSLSNDDKTIIENNLKSTDSIPTDTKEISTTKPKNIFITNQVKKFTPKELDDLVRSVKAINDSKKNEVSTLKTTVTKKETGKTAVTGPKQSNQVKAFTQKEVEAMTLALTATTESESKDKPKLAIVPKLKKDKIKASAKNDVTITENKNTESKIGTKPSTVTQPSANDVKTFTKKEVASMTATLTETKNTDANYKKQNSNAIEQIKIKILNLQESYKPNKSHSLIIEIQNEDNITNNLKLDVELPPNWTVISVSDIGSLTANQKKLVLLSFTIPADNPAGEIAANFILKNANGSTITSKKVNFLIEKNTDLEVFNLYTSSKLQAGETIEAKYEIKNKGNIEQEVTLSSKNNIKGDKTLKIAPNSSIIVETSQITDVKHFDFLTVATYLNVVSNTSGKSYKSYGTTQVFPSKLKQQDAFFRFPVRFSINYNSNTFQDTHYSTLSAEFTGDGFLDLQKKNYLSFIIRAPQQQNLKNFGITDQYSFVYNYNNTTTVYLGDHGHYINRLGFDSRFGMGFRVDQNIKKWTFTAFFSKPRLYTFNSEALFGVKNVYRFSKSMLLGIAIESSKGTIMGANKNIEANVDEKGQIVTGNYELRGKNTFINAESSMSVTNKNVDHAHYFNLVQKLQNLTYTGNFTFSGKNYFGNIRNSLEYSNSLFYKIKKFDLTIGQTLSQVNKRLNPLFFAAEPYFENYFGRIGYRIGVKNYFTIMLDKRVREDQLEPKSFFYKESGIDYRYLFTGRLLTLGLTGRIAETQNLLSDNLEFRTTYSHNLDAAYRFSNYLSIRTGITHNYSNRYGISSLNDNFYTYSLGIDINFHKNFRFNSNFNSGFSPEDTYLKRDFINANLLITLAKNHLFELRANYFENPGLTNRKELLAFGTYTYTFGLPIKRILEQGGINGLIQVNDESIDIKGIKIIAVGKSIVTNEKGIFEFNNLPLGTNYILMDESTLPFGVVSMAKTPFQVLIQQDKKVALSILLVRAATITGTFNLPVAEKLANSTLDGYVKIANDNFSYTVESNKNGIFKFQNIVPGTYLLTLIRHKGNQFFELENKIQITVGEGEKKVIDVTVKGKERKVQFKNKNFKIGG